MDPTPGYLRGVRRTRGASVPDWREFVIRPVRRDASIAELAKEYLGKLEREGSRSFADYRSTLAPEAPVLVSFGEITARDLGVDDVRAWLRMMRQPAAAYAERTLGKHFAGLGNSLRYGRDVGAVDVVVTELVPRGERPKKVSRDESRSAMEVLRPSQVRSLLTSRDVPTYRRILWRLLLYSGLRIGEASALQWGDIRAGFEPLGEILVRRSWHCRTREWRPTKTSHHRHVPLHPDLAAGLREARAWFISTFVREPGPEDLVCPWPTREGPRPWHETTALNWWRRDLEVCGIEHPACGPRRLHATRHSFVTNMLEAGADRNAVETLTHKVSGGSHAFRGYDHPSWERVCSAMMLLPYSRPTRENRSA